MSGKFLAPISLVVLLSMTVSASADLVGHWRFNEGSGTTTFDNAAGGTNGAVEGATWVNDAVRGWVLSFDGSDDRVHIPTSVFRFDEAFSVAVWLKTDTDIGGILYKANGDGSWQAQEKKFELVDPTDWSADGGRGAISGNFGLEGWGCDAATGGQVVDGQWHHAVMTWDGNQGGAVFYVDGQMAEANHNQYNIGQTDRDDDTLYVGWIHDEYFTGEIFL